MTERFYVLFRRSFRSVPRTSHETLDKQRTLCGRIVSNVGTLYADTNGCDPDCLYCRKVLARSKATGIIVTSAEKEDSSSARICKLEALLAQAVDVLDEYAYGFTVLRADIRRALGEDPE